MKKLLLILLMFPLIISAKSYTVIDTDSKRIIDSYNMHEVRSIASISKIMTAIIAIENGNLDKNIIVGDEIKDAYGSAIYIKEGEELTLRDLIYGLLLRSGNDAALTIAKNVSGDIEKFVKKMNEKALELKMYDTVFNNPTGLDEENGNYSSSYDMALLISYCMENKIFKEITSTKVYKLKTNQNSYSWTNKNKLLHTYKYTTGGKTGYTKKAKRTLITTAKKNNVNLAVVTLNYSNDFNFHKSMYEKYFKLYNNYFILKKGNISLLDETNLYIKNNYKVSLTDEESKHIIIKYKLNKDNNTLAGNVYVMLNDEILYKDNVYRSNNDK